MTTNNSSNISSAKFQRKIIDGKFISLEIESEISIKVKKLKKLGVIPSIAVILVGEDKASAIYVRNKQLAAERCGVLSQKYSYSADCSEKELLNKIEELNNDPLIHGILVQVPLPPHISEKNVMNTISPEKDVDGFHPLNTGKIFTGDSAFYPCTPHGILKMLDFYNIAVKGKNCVVIGQSNIVGKPLTVMFMNRQATVLSLNVFTDNIKSLTKKADILVSATGKPLLIDETFIKAGAVIIDVGISRVNGKTCGDVNFERVIDKVSKITPVPGGVGPVTVSMLMENTVKAAFNQNADKFNRSNL